MKKYFHYQSKPTTIEVPIELNDILDYIDQCEEIHALNRIIWRAQEVRLNLNMYGTPTNPNNEDDDFRSRA